MTYEDFLKKRDAGTAEGQLAWIVVNEHKSNKDYLFAEKAEKYYHGMNPTIMNLVKLIYDEKGKAVQDVFTADHKVTTKFFQFQTDQEVSYILGNGITFNEDSTLERLGRRFENRMNKLLTSAIIQGKSYGFWNFDHLEVFKFADTETEAGFAPLMSEITGQLMAGVRYWQIDNTKPLNLTLYTVDGIKNYQSNGSSNISLVSESKYIKKKQSFMNGEIYSESEENYESFPIFEFRYRDNGKSALYGSQGKIDAKDFITSGLVNNIEDANAIYWQAENLGGMDDMAIMQAIDRIKRLHFAVSPEGGSLTPHTVETNFSGMREVEELIDKSLYKDFQAFDEELIRASNQTIPGIQSCYTAIDLKADRTESQLTDFIETLLEFVGINDAPSYTRNKIINSSEEINSVLSASQFLSSEYVTKKILTILGDADQFDTVIEQMDNTQAGRFQDEDEDEDEESEEE